MRKFHDTSISAVFFFRVGSNGDGDALMKLTLFVAALARHDDDDVLGLDFGRRDNDVVIVVVGLTRRVDEADVEPRLLPRSRNVATAATAAQRRRGDVELLLVMIGRRRRFLDDVRALFTVAIAPLTAFSVVSVRHEEPTTEAQALFRRLSVSRVSLVVFSESEEEKRDQINYRQSDVK